MLLGLNLAVFEDREIHSALEFAATHGIQSVEINTDSTIDHPLFPGDLDNKKLQAIKHAVNASGIIISAIGNHTDSQLISGPHNTDTDKIFHGSPKQKSTFGTNRLLHTARIASELDVETVIGFTGCEDWSRWFPWPDKNGWANMLPVFIDTWSPILEQFRELGVRFAHEPHPKQMVYNLETAVEVTDAMGNPPEWGFNLDFANLSLAGVDPAVFIQTLPDKIFHTHAKDLEFVSHNLQRSGWQSHGPWGRPDRGFRFRIPGWGSIEWKRILTELQLSGYTHAISIEHEDPVFSREEGVKKAADFLKPLLITDPREPEWW